MEGTNKRFRSVMAFLILAVLLVVMVDNNTRGIDPHKVTVDKEDADEVFQVSYEHGEEFAEIYNKIRQKVESGEVTKEQFATFQLYVNICCLKEASYKNLRRAYRYAAEILDETIQFEYCDEVDQNGYMLGFISINNLTTIIRAWLHGDIPYETLEETTDKYIELTAVPTERDVLDFVEFTEKILSEVY